MKSIFVIIATALAVSAQINVDSVEPLNLVAPIPMHPEEFIKQGRITGGHEAKPHAYPYQAGLSLHMADGKTGWCGGSIISKDYVLTAAHCTDKAESVTVHLGAHNIKIEEEGALHIEVPKSDIIVHEKWNMISLTNDISLIRLPEPIEFNDKIQPVNLPKWSQQAQDFVDATVTASGWGKDSDSATSVSPILRYIDIPVLGQFKCNIYFLGKIGKTHICIKGEKGQSTCNGDSGGPLVFTEEDGSKTLLGATSFGIALGCEKGWPGVFTRVSSFLDWIENNSDIKIRS